MLEPDYAFADALIIALARALDLTTPDAAAQMQQVCGEEARPVEAPPIPFGCVLWSQPGRTPMLRATLSVGGSKVGLGYYPYTAEGAAEAMRVREAAVAVKKAGGDGAAVKAAAERERKAA